MKKILCLIFLISLFLGENVTMANENEQNSALEQIFSQGELILTINFLREIPIFTGWQKKMTA